MTTPAADVPPMLLTALHGLIPLHQARLAALSAHALIESLRHGDPVTYTRDGHTSHMTVTGRPTLTDGHGDATSLGVTLTAGPGRYSTRIDVAHLVHGRGRLTRA